MLSVLRHLLQQCTLHTHAHELLVRHNHYHSTITTSIHNINNQQEQQPIDLYALVSKLVMIVVVGYRYLGILGVDCLLLI